MTWVYHQSDGLLTKDGVTISYGYAGKGTGKFKTNMESVPNTGPLPRGRYTIIGHPFHHPHTGAYSLRLQPDAHNKMFGRAGFLIHGDSNVHPGEASDGCIVLGILIRQRIWNSGDRIIEVVK